MPPFLKRRLVRLTDSLKIIRHFSHPILKYLLPILHRSKPLLKGCRTPAPLNFDIPGFKGGAFILYLENFPDGIFRRNSRVIVISHMVARRHIIRTLYQINEPVLKHRPQMKKEHKKAGQPSIGYWNCKAGHCCSDTRFLCPLPINSAIDGLALLKLLC